MPSCKPDTESKGIFTGMDESVLRIVADNLRRWQSEIKDQRHIPVNSPGFAVALQERLAESGLLDEAQERWAARDRRQRELEVLYGEAVRRVPGAVNEDLLILDDIGALLIELDENAEPSYLRASLTREKYFETIRRKSAPRTQGEDKEESLVALRSSADGQWIITPHQPNRFTPDGRFDELRAALNEFMAEWDSTPSRSKLGSSSAAYPDTWEAQIRQAVQLKREGQFLASAKIYMGLTRVAGTVYTGVLLSLYKTVACAGDLLDGNFLLMRALTIFQLDPHPWPPAKERPTTFQDHLSRLLKSASSEASLEAYLRDISGNADYRLPRDYPAMVRELREHYANVAKLQASAESPRGGCYIATAVYGSYDAPPVLTLRRFRDRKLAGTATGRTAIKVYYAVSPSLAKRLGRTGVLNRMVKLALDAVVESLDRRGYSNDSAEC
ncbi:CFI-box-CTERM domain-containing protein [Agromyces mariniharenae]|uniref:Uncharacterized protein n=1 Tax=Agromyces mariniharenae TaxID=2604423 RepID=A0A5S4UTY4_9MICO|nr:CFI-box-CTERM domain-containing protein [Agromyces mariniharenae]TYL50434.1 hypothetical protein FYC51_14600 [Agromyces mariniharenae]